MAHLFGARRRCACQTAAFEPVQLLNAEWLWSASWAGAHRAPRDPDEAERLGRALCYGHHDRRCSPSTACCAGLSPPLGPGGSAMYRFAKLCGKDSWEILGDFIPSAVWAVTREMRRFKGDRVRPKGPGRVCTGSAAAPQATIRHRPRQRGRCEWRRVSWLVRCPGGRGFSEARCYDRSARPTRRRAQLRKPLVRWRHIEREFTIISADISAATPAQLAGDGRAAAGCGGSEGSVLRTPGEVMRGSSQIPGRPRRVT